MSFAFENSRFAYLHYMLSTTVLITFQMKKPLDVKQYAFFQSVFNKVLNSFRRHVETCGFTC